ncbi:MAG: rhomboid family intramembrane serine protease [marine benthic group bacterium]|jgi:membrane associated rhomboid family serine protease|nr:rhomboid family intramembrane serine protease [Candidatus Benthicola marisminoris]
MTPWVTRLLFANVAIFFLSGAVPSMYRMFALVPEWVISRPWTLFTYMFLHGGFWHLAFNMLVLYFFGPRLESRLGSRTFLQLYFFSGLVAGLVSVVVPFLLPTFSTMTAVVGASGALYGVLLAFAHYWPDERILIIPIPVPIRIRTMVVLATLIAIGGIAMEVMGSRQQIAHHAHLGGFLGAWVFMKWRERNSPAARFKKQADPAPKRGWLQDRDAAQRWAAIDRESLHPVNREAYDEIMDKLRTEGIGSLTDRERAFLERFSQA